MVCYGLAVRVSSVEACQGMVSFGLVWQAGLGMYRLVMLGIGLAVEVGCVLVCQGEARFVKAGGVRHGAYRSVKARLCEACFGSLGLLG